MSAFQQIYLEFSRLINVRTYRHKMYDKVISRGKRQPNQKKKSIIFFVKFKNSQCKTFFLVTGSNIFYLVCLASSSRSTRAIRSMPPPKKLGTTFYSLELNVSFLIIFNIDQNAFVYSGQMILAYN